MDGLGARPRRARAVPAHHQPPLAVVPAKAGTHPSLRYTRGLELPDETIAALSKRIGKLSPAFIKELDRRAAQAMLERGGNELAMEDFERALGDRVRSGGKLSARLAGAEGAVGFV